MTAPEAILLVDDERALLNAMRRRLRRRYHVDIAESGAEALARIKQDGPYAVIVSDMRMPGINGVELLEQVAALAPQTARMMLTGNVDQETARQAVNRGQIFQFLTKPCANAEFENALNEGLRIYRDALARDSELTEAATRLRDLSERLTHENRFDRLTQLLSRDAFVAAVEDLAETAPASVLGCLNIDQFRAWNELHGNAAGDELLCELAALLARASAQGELAARIGGAEYAVLWRREQAETRMRALQQAFRELRLPWSDRGLGQSFSAGILLLDDAARQAGDVLQTVQTASVIAKQRGIGQIYRAAAGDSELQSRQDELIKLADLHEALAAERFELHYQPIAPIGEVHHGEHIEILVRMRDAAGALQAPDRFLPVAERFKVSPRLDCMVVEKTLKWLSEHSRICADLGVCAINLSGHSLSSAETLDFIERCISQYDVAPDKLCFEVTENAAVANFSLTIEFMEALRARGCRFSLDDFGSGLSSFAYLRVLPVDYLKIDGNFVRDIDENTTNRALVRAINDMGHALGKVTIAEYAENDAILAVLRTLAVDYAQGYGIAAPSPIDALPCRTGHRDAAAAGA